MPFYQFDGVDRVLSNRSHDTHIYLQSTASLQFYHV